MKRLNYPYRLLLCALLLSLQWALVISGLASHTYAKNETQTAGDETSADDGGSGDGQRLTYVKLGVALGMFCTTAGACALPLIIVTCVARRVGARSSGLSLVSGGTSPSYTSRNDDRGASSPHLLLDPQSTESEELLLTRGTDSQSSPDLPDTPGTAITSAGGGGASFYDADSSSGGGGSGGGGLMNGAAPGGSMGNGAIPPMVHLKTTRRRDTHRRMRAMRKWASRINCFAAGIFLTTGLMDLFPEVQDATAVALSALKVNSEYPFAALFTLLGFFMVLAIEQSAHICRSRQQQQQNRYNHQPHSHSHQQDGHHHGGHSHEIPGDQGGSIFHLVVLLVALSVHSVFEGLAVGLQKSVTEVVTLFTALLLHKLIMAASIGFSMATAHQQREDGIARSQWLGVLFFALASPIGVMIGWALIAQRSSPALLMAIAVLQGLACGTFFFVVFCEMLPQEFGDSHDHGDGSGGDSSQASSVTDRLGKIAGLVLGFTLVATYIAFVPE